MPYRKVSKACLNNLIHFPSRHSCLWPLIVEKVCEVFVGQWRWCCGRTLERESVAKESVTVVSLTKRVASSHQSCKVSHTKTHHRDVILQQSHWLIKLSFSCKVIPCQRLGGQQESEQQLGKAGGDQGGVWLWFVHGRLDCVGWNNCSQQGSRLQGWYSILQCG